MYFETFFSGAISFLKNTTLNFVQYVVVEYVEPPRQPYRSQHSSDCLHWKPLHCENKTNITTLPSFFFIPHEKLKKLSRYILEYYSL